MFVMKIEKVAEILVLQSAMFSCTLERAWDKYMHDLIKKQFTYEQVKQYIDDIDLVNKMNPKALNK